MVAVARQNSQCLNIAISEEFSSGPEFGMMGLSRHDQEAAGKWELSIEKITDDPFAFGAA